MEDYDDMSNKDSEGETEHIQSPADFGKLMESKIMSVDNWKGEIAP